jgi:hypothetical protein
MKSFHSALWCWLLEIQVKLLQGTPENRSPNSSSLSVCCRHWKNPCTDKMSVEGTSGKERSFARKETRHWLAKQRLFTQPSLLQFFDIENDLG